MKDAMDVDGQGFNLKSRPIQLTQKDLQMSIFDEHQDLQDSFDLIDTFCLLSFKPFGDIDDENQWEPRCTKEFIQNVKSYEGNQLMLKTLVFYLMCAARGILFLRPASEYI